MTKSRKGPKEDKTIRLFQKKDGLMQFLENPETRASLTQTILKRIPLKKKTAPADPLPTVDAERSG